jgi:hypothetical protein
VAGSAAVKSRVQILGPYLQHFTFFLPLCYSPHVIVANIDFKSKIDELHEVYQMKVLRFEVKYFNIVDTEIFLKPNQIRIDLGKSGKLEIFGKIWKIWN